MRIYYDQPDFTRAWMPAALFEEFSNIIGSTSPWDIPLMARRMGVEVEGRELQAVAADVHKRARYCVRQHVIARNFRGN